jgi:hypothetical protein
MERQLLLLDSGPEWRLDDGIRAVGRAGVAAARASLMAARRQSDRDESDGRRRDDQRPAA